MRKHWILSLVLGLLLLAGASVVAAPPGGGQQQYTDLVGTVTYGKATPDAGAHIYLVAGDAETVTSSNLDEIVAKAFRVADADDKGEWRMLQVYSESYKLIMVSAHITGDARIFQIPVSVSGGGEYQRRVDHQF